jgi:hypothetical protein
MGPEVGILLTHQPIDTLRKKLPVTLLESLNRRGLHVFVRPGSAIYDRSSVSAFKNRDSTLNARRHRGTLPHAWTVFIRKWSDMLHDNAGTHVALTDNTTLGSMFWKVFFFFHP